MMKLTGFPFFTGAQFDDAISVLQEARVAGGGYGMPLPFYAPGGHYGTCWWSLDYALAMEGVKWLCFDDARNYIANLCAAQCPNGRIKLYGADNFAHIPNVREDVASLPKYFESGLSVALMSGDVGLCTDTAKLFEASLRWWKEHRLHRDTGLYTAVFEETFIPNTVSGSYVYAPVDTNAQLIIGMENTAALLRLLNRQNDALRYQAEADDLRDSMNRYMWNDNEGLYLPYVITDGRQYPARMASAFMGFYVGNERQNGLLEANLRGKRFGWDETPITSVAVNDPLFTTVTGDYQGNASWSGSVWTLINDQTIKALRRAGRHETANLLVLKTLKAFAGNYAEFLHPITGRGEGVARYAWTAGQVIRLMVEEVFGLRYDGFSGQLSAAPMQCAALNGCELRLTDISLPNGRRVDVAVLDGSVISMN